MSINQRLTMLPKLFRTIFTDNGVKTFSSVINQSLITKCYGKRSNLLMLPKTGFLAGSTKRFAENEATPTSSRALTRQDPGPVRLGFIPDEWFTFFFPKTGVSGLGTFIFTVTISLMSKEIYVMEHEYYGGLSMAILCIVTAKYIGPVIAKYLDEEVDAYEKSWSNITTNNKKILEDNIKNEVQLQWSCEGQLQLIEAKRENVALQLEAAYRERLMQAYAETKKRLEYCVERSEVEKAFIRRHMTHWVVKEVSKALSETIEKESVDKCLEDLQKLAKSFQGFTSPYPSDVASDSSPDPPPKIPGKPKK